MLRNVSFNAALAHTRSDRHKCDVCLYANYKSHSVQEREREREAEREGRVKALFVGLYHALRLIQNYEY